MLFLFLCSVIGTPVCPCQINTAGNNPGCCCDGINDINSFPDGCYQKNQKNIIQKCPANAFKQTLPLKDWLVKELFCLKDDRRRSTEQIYSSNSEITYIPNITDSNSVSSMNEPGGYIYDGNDKIVNIIGSFTSSQCTEKNPLLFLEQIHSSSCTLGPVKFIDFYSNFGSNGIKSAPGSAEKISVNKTNWTKTQNSIKITIIYSSDESHLIKSVNLEDGSAYNSQNTEFFTTVIFQQENTELIPQSGEIGYEVGEPVIAAKLVKTNLSFYPSQLFGSFPVPLSVGGSPTSWSPLLYGENTFSQYTLNNNNVIDDIFGIAYVSRFGKIINADASDQWVKIEGYDNPDCKAGNRTYSFYTLKNGTISAPIRTIDHAVVKCKAVTQSIPIFTAQFIEYPQNANRYIGKFPIGMIRIPVDFFYPFSKPSTKK